ncbi:hypothetical protein CCR95_05250 [Thiocystis minor]|uniref:hypothetical protein n=1 Tax=Thiocystis minor TaxID=61597 RepID=UPI0019138CD3|nr:hypothetical protein [Thiocystis minor]MBK5963509.1 hypothetical protein [Thiocystis minor]
MKQFSQLTLASSIALALAAGMGTAYQASANPALDIATPTTSEWDTASQTGDTLLFPYYTVRDDASGNPLITTFTVTNTGDDVLVLKFRLRDSKNSDDVLDFMWIMSPHDEVVAYMDRTADGTPRVNFPADENSCRVPFGKSSYTASKGDVPNLAASQEGHMEVIPMAALDPASTYGLMAIHDQTKNPPLPADCSTLNKLFGGLVAGVTTEALLRSTLAGAAGGATAVENDLRGSYTITAQASGFSGGGSAMALSNWDDAVWTTPAPSISGLPGLLFFQLGSLAATSTLQDNYDNKQYYHPHLGDSSAVVTGGGKATASALDNGSIAAASVANNWSVNPGNGVGTDWVVTFPTKYLYRTSRNATTVNGLKVVESDYAPPFDTEDSNLELRCTETTVKLYNREEGDVEGGGAIISPSPSEDPTYLCNEVNVLSFSDDSGNFNPVLRAKDDLDMLFDTTGVVQPYGWASLNLGTNADVAVDGFAFTRRNIGQSNTAFGSIIPHTLQDVGKTAP